MTLTINTNISALSAQRNLNMATQKSAASIAKLSSGSRIVSAKDDAASLAIASGLKLDLASLRAAQANVAQGSSILQIADGGYSQISDVLGRMKTLSSTAQSDQISDTERGFLDTEYGLLLQEINRIADSTEFNGIELLGGAAALSVSNIGANVNNDAGFVGYTFDPGSRAVGDVVTIAYNNTTHVFNLTVANGGNTLGAASIDLDDISGNPFDIGGNNTLDAGTTYELNFASIGVKLNLSADFAANTAVAANNTATVAAGTATTAANLNFLVGISATDTIGLTLQIGTTAALGLAGTSVTNKTNAQNAGNAIDAAVQTINTARSQVGSALSRLEFAGSNVAVQIENSEAARSVLEDVNVADEFTKFTSSQVLVQAGVSILAQANQQPQLLLRLLQG